MPNLFVKLFKIAQSRIDSPVVIISDYAENRKIHAKKVYLCVKTHVFNCVSSNWSIIDAFTLSPSLLMHNTHTQL